MFRCIVVYKLSDGRYLPTRRCPRTVRLALFEIRLLRRAGFGVIRL